MTPQAIIKQAADDGVILALTPAGTIKTTGARDAVNRWLPMLRSNRDVIVAALRDAANDPAQLADTSPAWLLRFVDRAPVAVHFAPAAAYAEVLAAYPDASAAVPLPESAPKTTAPSCKTCQHLRRPGLAAGYCGGRDDLPPAYTAGHPLRSLPDDQGKNCRTWELVT